VERAKPVTRCNSLRVTTSPVRNSCRSSPALLGPDGNPTPLSSVSLWTAYDCYRILSSKFSF